MDSSVDERMMRRAIDLAMRGRGRVEPNPMVRGGGIKVLRDAGIVVDGGILEAAALQVIAPFMARVVHHRPYVTLKWAQSADRKVAGAGRRRVQISNAASMRASHGLRS